MQKRLTTNRSFLTVNEELAKLSKYPHDKAGLTVRELAKPLDMHHSIVDKIENGERRIDVVEFVAYCRVTTQKQ